MGWGEGGSGFFEEPKRRWHLYKNDPKRDPNSENCPC